MTQLLEKAIAEIKKLPTEEQDAYARWMLEELARLTGTELTRIRVTGGGTRNPRWLEAKAALGPCRFQVVQTDEAAALGAALVGGVAGGVYETVAEAMADSAPADRGAVSRGARARYEATYRDRWLPAVLAPRR